MHTSLDPSAIGEADGGNSDDSESSIGDSSQPDKSRETEALISSPSLDLVITPCKERGTIQIIPWSTWRGRRDLVLINDFPAREKPCITTVVCSVAKRWPLAACPTEKH